MKSLEWENIPIYTVADPGEGPTHPLFFSKGMKNGIYGVWVDTN